MYIEKLIHGENIALVSKAGSPLINDPGYFLIKNAKNKNIRIVPIPGPCAAITALIGSGLSTVSFSFEGFFPKKKILRKKKIKNLKNETKTMIFYESPKRLIDTIQDIKIEMGEKKIISIAKELTKKWEYIYTGNVKNIENILYNNNVFKKGELVVLIEGNKMSDGEIKMERILQIFQIIEKYTSKKNALKIINKIYGIKKNLMYNKIVKKIIEVD